MRNMHKGEWAHMKAILTAAVIAWPIVVMAIE